MKMNGMDFLKKDQEALKSKSAKIGSYSLAITAIAVGILIAVNVLAATLPKNLTQFDISSQRLYSVTSNTKVVVNNLDKDITIYWITQSGQEDDTIERLLNVYDSMSDKVTVEKKNPDVYPTFASQYTSDTVNNNSLVVTCGDRFRYIDYNDIYDADTASAYAGGSVSYSFDGEGEITSAINYVVSDDLPKVYLTTGHGEAELSETVSEAILRANMETEDFTLLNVDEIPEEADVILVNSPTDDFSEEEIKMLKDYVSAGGKLMVLSGPQQETELTNLQSIAEDYGVSFAKGIVLEEDREHYGFNYPYILIPDIESSDITTALIDEKDYVLVPLASGMTIGDGGSATVTGLLSTSDTAFSKADGYKYEHRRAGGGRRGGTLLCGCFRRK